MTLFAQIIALFHREDIPCALIGASALAVHGIPRSTYDLDLLTTSPRALEPSLWEPLSAHGVSVDVRAGDAADPLRGVVRMQQAGDRDVDVVVGRHQWQRDLLGRAVPSRVLNEDVPVVLKGDLILLKLYAGGHQDVWDIEQLLADADQDVRTHVASRISVLPPDCQSQWTELTRRR
ncbi:MAG: hypothetical protein HYX77_02885 [Acidobacteria bacterium]|nr:hypothetical protein [Acidobacteriota bacterium]